MLKIKLVRVGRRKNATFRVVVAEHRSSGNRPAEYLGLYTPKDGVLDIDMTRVNHWLGVGAQLTSGMNALLKKKLPGPHGGDL